MELLVRVTWWVVILFTVQIYGACIPSHYQDIHTPILHKCPEFNKKAETIPIQHLDCTNCHYGKDTKPTSKVAHQPNCLCDVSHNGKSVDSTGPTHVENHKCAHPQCGARCYEYSAHRGSYNSRKDYNSPKPNSVHSNLNKNQTTHHYQCKCNERSKNTPNTTSSKPITTKITESGELTTEISTEPTETSTEPTEVSTEPTELPTEPTEVSTEPTETSTQPTGEGEPRELTEEYYQSTDKYTLTTENYVQSTEAPSLIPRFLEPWSFPVQPKRIYFYKH